MILIYCQKCEHHLVVEGEGEIHSKCEKENCLSVYSECVAKAELKTFIAQNTSDQKRQLSALDICYPSA